MFYFSNKVYKYCKFNEKMHFFGIFFVYSKIMSYLCANLG